MKCVLLNCRLQCYLCTKALETGYLTHFERLSILHVFGHLGEAGKAFVHQVMGYTLNYRYEMTEKFIRRRPERPVSCIKLREQYKTLTAEIGCSCIFREIKNCYPSPVLHAIRKSTPQMDITLPISRQLTEEKKQNLIGTINNQSKLSELLKALSKLRKQQRELADECRKTEKALSMIFDEAGTDQMELDIGTLVRAKKTDGSWKWTVII